MKAFERDLNSLMERLNGNSDDFTNKKLLELRDKLIRLKMDNLVKISHSVMELVCAKYLILKGYDVDVEHPLEGGLTCDLYGVKGYGTEIVEIETGYIPPAHALNPIKYTRARIASKIVRYGTYANKFGLGTPPHYILSIPPVFTKPPRYRLVEELKKVKGLCDVYYKYPPVSLKEIKNTRLHAIYIIDADKGDVWETEPDVYIEQYLYKCNIFNAVKEVSVSFRPE